jgi:hypothetical protein
MDSSLEEVKSNLVDIISRVNDAKEIAPLIKDGMDISGTASTTFELKETI